MEAAVRTFSLGRLGVASEVRKLTWRDIDWERQRILVHSPKTERYEGREAHLIPLFSELLPLLEQRYDEAEEGDLLVLPMLKAKTDAALRKPVERAIERAGLKQWPRLWHNLRASRQTDLESVPGLSRHAVCEWLGNTESVARKHYLQVREDDYAKMTGEAAGLGSKKAQQQASQDIGTVRQGSEHHCEKPNEFADSPNSVVAGVPPRGFEQAQQCSSSRKMAVCAAQINALGSDFDAIESNLAEVTEAWPRLSDSVRATILAIVRESFIHRPR